MKYQVSLSRDVAKTFRRIHPQDAKRLKNAIFSLASDPRPPGSIQLSGGQGELRIRVGDYRIIYEIHDRELVVLVLRIGHRRQVYR